MNETRTHKKRDIFIEGPIDPNSIAVLIQKHTTRTDIGAHEIFLGQIRADERGASDDADTTLVTGIEYTTYYEMALEQMDTIRETTFAKWPSITCLHVQHSLGKVAVGQLCFMVFASAPHRQDAREAVAFLSDAIKKELPIFGKECFDDNTHTWKTNRT